MRAFRLMLVWLAVLAGVPVLAACVGSPPDTTAVSGALRVLAPTSLTNVLPVLVYQFTTTHGDVHVQVTYGPDVRSDASGPDAASAGGRASAGPDAASAGGRASAGPDAASAGGRASAGPSDVVLVEGASALAGVAAGPPRVFADDQIVLAVPLGDPGSLGGVPDLARPGLRVARCAPVQPCGQTADSILGAAGIRLAQPILVDDVRSAIDLVVRHEADVALVYRTDAQQFQDSVTAVEFPESSDAVAQFQAATLDRAANPDAAKAFVDFLVSDRGRDILSGHLFQLP
jgi:molybdate transport system substrate-binding protein